MSDATDREEAVVRLARKVLVRISNDPNRSGAFSDYAHDAFQYADAFYEMRDKRLANLREENGDGG